MNAYCESGTAHIHYKTMLCMVDVNPILQMVGSLSLGKVKWLHEVNLRFYSKLPDYNVIELSTLQMFLLSCQTRPNHTQSQGNVSELFYFYCDFHWQGGTIAMMLIIL